MDQNIEKCEHWEQIKEGVTAKTKGCEECLKTGDTWVHLRTCLVCGHVGCCDSSKNTHATKHYHATDHAMMQSYEPKETWMWCYIDEKGFMDVMEKKYKDAV